MRIVTSCGHVIMKAPPRFEEHLNKGITFDCPECGNLEVMHGEILAFQTKSFHKWMHEEAIARGDEFVWPADGKGTGYVELASE